MKMIGFANCLWLAGIIWAAGCGAPKPAPDPLAGWRFCSLNELHANKSIMDDYQNYIQNLPPQRRQFVGSINFYQDGTGQHAVDISIGVNGTWWEHVLFYDRSDQRLRTIKYTNGRYRS